MGTLRHAIGSTGDAKAELRAGSGSARATERREAAKALVDGISKSDQFTFAAAYIDFVANKRKK